MGAWWRASPGLRTDASSTRLEPRLVKTGLPEMVIDPPAFAPSSPLTVRPGEYHYQPRSLPEVTRGDAA